jgi:hypothetical protein
MSRRTDKMASEAAAEANQAAVEPVSEPINPASEAGRVLRAQRDKPVEKPEPVTPRHEQNPRNKIYAELVESRKESSDLSQSDTDKPEEIKPEAPAPDAVAPASPPVDPPPSTEPVAAAPTVKVKVDGEEFEVPQSEVDEAGGVQSYRMVKAMENRLKKATDTATEARKTQEQTMQLLQSLFQQQRQPQVTPQQAAARKAELVEQMVYGDTQQKLAAYEELSKLNSGQQFDPQQFKQSLKVELAIQSSADKFKSEFADLISNPDILALATIKERQMLDKYNMSNLPASFDTEYRKIGNELRALVSRPSQPTQVLAETPQPAIPATDKEARKSSNIVSLPQASARATPKEKEELTPDQARNKALRDMRRARGQPTE